MVWFLMDLDILRGFGFWMEKSDGFVPIAIPNKIQEKLPFAQRESTKRIKKNFIQIQTEENIT